MTTALTSARRSELRAAAHKLSPVVIIGDKGPTDAVVLEADAALKAHELIKVKAATDDRQARRQWMADLCARLAAHPVQEIGKVLVIYRENEKPKEKAPVRAVKRESAAPKGTSRPRSRTPSARPESEPRRRRPRSSR